jgi:hypothetical protein
MQFEVGYLPQPKFRACCFQALEFHACQPA